MSVESNKPKEGFVLDHKIEFPSSSSSASNNSLDTVGFVLIHGLTSAWQTFLNVLKELADVSKLPVIAVSLRGHGKSPEVEIGSKQEEAAEEATTTTITDFSAKTLANDISATLQFLKVKTVKVALGHSWGSRCCLQFCKDHQQREQNENYPPLVVEACIIEDEYMRSDTKTKGPPIGEKALLEKVMKMRSRWPQDSKTTPHFDSEEACNSWFLETAGDPAKSWGFPDFSRKIGSSEVSTGEKEDEEKQEAKKKQIFFPLFKPHASAAWDEHARCEDMTSIWKDEDENKKRTFPILIIAGDPEEGADVSQKDFEELKQYAESVKNRVDSVGRRMNDIVQIDGAAHTVHRAKQEEFLAACDAFVNFKKK